MKRSAYPILGLLSVQPMSGYGLKKTIEASLGNFWSESFGQIYPLLSELKKSKLIAPHGEAQLSGRRKVAYKITDAGMSELKKWLEEDPIEQVMRNELLLKIFFGTETEQNVIADHLDAALIAARAKLTQLLLIEKNLERAPYDGEHKRYWHMTIRFGLLHIQATVEWCEESLKILSQVSEKGEK